MTKNRHCRHGAERDAVQHAPVRQLPHGAVDHRGGGRHDAAVRIVHVRHPRREKDDADGVATVEVEGVREGRAEQAAAVDVEPVPIEEGDVPQLRRRTVATATPAAPLPTLGDFDPSFDGDVWWLGGGGGGGSGDGGAASIWGWAGALFLRCVAIVLL